ncbi:MAG: hypothetical protein EAZ70_13000 [Runella slithyformis]|nr:MAG: hypothetical protein EAY79_13545 [Runella slithyformis]TAF23399.1 MAG: hypothetical protein EAZ70_13000 [Runella slithyformis]TAF43423.1 MAG: hypothetical protein EAZ63_13770 [Runella slithyformis]TAF79580.1 MAG: hypothetical protein EAZ50_10975 [Runella slithyformis]
MFMYTNRVLEILIILIFSHSKSFGRVSNSDLTITIQRDSTIKSNQKEVLNFFSYGEDILKKHGAKAAVDSLLQFESTFANSKDFGRKSFYYQVLMTFYSFFDYKKGSDFAVMYLSCYFRHMLPSLLPPISC